MDLLQLLKGSSSSSSNSGNASDSDSDNNEEKEPPQRHTGKYGGEEDEEEDEEDKEDDDDLNNNNAEPKGKRRIKKRRLGSVSILLSNQVPTTNTTNATNALFVRSVPHRKGHWSGHVMVPVLIDSSSPFLQQQQQKTIHKFQKELEQRGYSGTLVQHESLHLSLSKFFSLQLGCIEPFVQRLKTRLQHQHSTRLFMDTNYNYNYNNNNQETNILVNDEKTRSFLGWNVVPNSDLFRLVGHVDDVLKSYNQPSYYQPPRFHVSIASFPGNLKDMSPMNENNDKEEEDEEDSIDDDNDDHSHRYCINVDRVWCKFGTTKSYEIPLQSSPAAHKHR